MKRILLLFCVLLLASCADTAKDNEIVIGASPFPHRAILDIAKPLLEKEGYVVELKEFSDYVQPNVALAEGSLYANFYQHEPYLNNMKAEMNLDLVPVAKVHIEPLGFYSIKIKSLDELKEGDTIAIPNDPTNGFRALSLLQDSGLIKIPDDELVSAKDITENKLKLQIKELEAAILPRTLSDVTAAVINTNFAAEANLVPSKDAIVIESTDSPYVNIVVVRGEDKDSEKTQAIVKAMNSPEVREYIKNELEPRGIVAAF